MLNKLAQLREERTEDEQGFTLIELLVVVVIIGVLVAIAIPLYLNYRKGAENKDAQSDVRNAVGAIESCIADNQNKVPSGTVTSATGSIFLTCTAGGTGAASATNPGTPDQTINLSDSVQMTFTPSGTTAYTIVGIYGGAGSGHKTYTYTSSSGKTATT